MSEDRKPIPFVTYDADGRIDMDLQGLKYGYNLRTLRDDGECPECGANIYESARLGWLFQCDPAWLRRMAGATTWLLIAMICFALILARLLLGQTALLHPDNAAGHDSIGASAGTRGVPTPHGGPHT